MATPLGIKYTDKNRPRGFYLVNGKEKYWDGKKYKDRPSSSDTGFSRFFTQSDEAKNRIAQLQIQEKIAKKGRGVNLGDFPEDEDYKTEELKYFKAAEKDVAVPEAQAPEPVDSEPAAVEPVTTAEEPVEPEPVQASAITKPQTNRQLMVAEAKRKYKDSPFKQWAHANQRLAMALKPGQAGYAQVQEYLKESGLLKTKDLQIKPKGKKQDSVLNIEQLQFNPGQARGADGFTEGERRFVRPLPRSEQVDTPGMGMAMANPLRGYTG